MIASTRAPLPWDRAALREAAIWFLASRAVLVLIGVLSISAIEPDAARTNGGSLADLFCRWDCGWYMGIAERGYAMAHHEGQSNFAFYPVFPLLVRAIARVTSFGYVHAALLVANACFFAALCYVHAYARLLGSSERAASLALALLAFAPQAFVFSAGYTESTFLLLLVAAMYHVRREQFLVAGILAATLSGTRATGIFFLFFVLAWVWRTHGLDAILRPWRRPELFVPVVLAPLGLFAFWTWSFANAGDAFAMSSTVSHGWGWRSAPPWENLWAHLRYDPISRFWAIGSMAVAALCGLLWRRRMWEELVLCAAVFLLLWSGQVPNSLLRYSIVLFPVWIALGQHLEKRPLAGAFTFVVFGLVGGFLMVAWTLGRLIAI